MDIVGSFKNFILGGCSNTLRGTPNVQMQGAQKTNREAYIGYTLSGAVCSATKQMSVRVTPRDL
jgi:hypothetical protein